MEDEKQILLTTNDTTKTYDRTWTLKDSNARILHLLWTSKHCLAFQTLGSCLFSSYESRNEHNFQNNMFHSNTRWWIKSINPAIPTWNIPWQPNFHYSSISINYPPCTMHYNRISEPLSVSVISWSQTDTQCTVLSQQWDFIICFQLWIKFYLKLHTYYYTQVYYKETRHKDFVILNKLYLFHRKVLPNKLSRFLVLSLFHLSNSMYISYTHFSGIMYPWFRISGHQNTVKSNVLLLWTVIKLEFKITLQTVPWCCKWKWCYKN